ncbi:uncharacterized protein Tco025E_02653 [Trypanosoma conorhini]|uniref:Uncharacterized protein n=1 Tax=Trypanosoma conorhini TaxID=83891 RepID=A0A3R7L9Z7_9TRYP|nr:uncharacterized protein Tco025E_02653 [Trypanosoma conorhini]RNF24096.1 hypothetical protein Tco025E_02653 [Trypanosoma conorhini]
MPYARPTVSSRRRSRTPSAGPRRGSPPPTAEGAPTQAARSGVPPRLQVRSRVGGDSYHVAKKARKESRTVHPGHDEEEVRLSQELTSHCDAVVQRVHALLDKTQAQEEYVNRALKESLGRSPPRPSSASPKGEAVDSLSPQPSSTGRTPRESATRWSGMFGTPKAPLAPPPTPARPDSSAAGWLSKLLGRSPEAQPTPTSKSVTPPLHQSTSPRPADATSVSPTRAAPAEQGSLLQRAIQRLSGRLSSPPPEEATPQRSRKSVVFKRAAELETLTPPRPTRRALETQGDSEPEPRSSLLYPPAPPPSLQKEVARRSSSGTPPSVDGAKQLLLGPDVTDVAGVIRSSSHSRAFRQLTKADLVAYAKLHHVALAMSSTKKELFEVARRLAKGQAGGTQ